MSLIEPTVYSAIPAGPAIERPGSTTSCGTFNPRCAQPAMDHLDEFARRGRIVVSRVRNAKATTRSELARLETEVVSQLNEQVEHDGHRVFVSTQAEDLRSDVRVQADQFEARMPESLFHCAARRAGLDRKTELGIELSCGDVIVRVRLDPGRKPEHDRGSLAFRDHLPQQLELVL